MLVRLSHAAVAFAITAVVYQLYAIAVAPFVEPAAAAAPTVDADADADHLAAAPQKHRELLSAYFPPSHWCLQSPPKTIESGQALVIVNNDRQSDDGKLHIGLCAVIFFPNGRVRGGEPPRDAIILEAPHGAVLQLDDNLNSGPTSFGRIQWGELRSRIHIYSDMTHPGPEDDLHIVTSNLRLNESGLSTRDAVEVKLGKHRGRGRGLEIRRLSSDRNRRPGGVFSGLDVLEIASEASLDLAAGDLKLFGKPLQRPPESLALSAPAGAFPAAAADVSSAGSTPPIRIKCDGPFRYDFANNKASFQQNVSARQVQHDGQLDQLLADELNLYMIKAAEKRPAETSADGEDAKVFGNLQPGTLEAKGALVELDAPSYDATVRGQRLRIQIPQRLLTVDGGDEATLKYRGTEIHAPMVRYRLPPDDAATRLGEMLANGRGWLRAVVDKKRPHDRFELSWSTSMRLDRENGAPTLSVIGRPRAKMPGVGRLMADEMRVVLRENSKPGDGSSANGESAKPNSDAVMPERLVATGAVSIDAPELTCRVNQLTLWVREEGADPSDDPAAATDRSADQPRDFLRRRTRRAYAVSGDKLALLVTLRDKKPDVSRVSVIGNVLFQESAASTDEAPPLRVSAHQLRVDHADTPEAEITVLGSPAEGNAQAAPAEITVRGTTLRAASLQLNRGTSQAWIDAPGEVQLQLGRDLTGAELPKPETLTVTWRDSMRLDGDQITFLGNVMTQTASGWLQTPRLVARLSAPVQFDGASSGKQPELNQVEGYEGVLAQFEQRDAEGLTARHRIRLVSLVANQRTGDLSGDGPGQIESTHLAKGSGLFSQIAGKDAEPASNKPVQRLRYLNTEFSRQLSGNLHRSEIRLHGNVRTVYGPVDAWEQKLKPVLGEDPAPHTVHIECETLSVRESAAGQLFTPPGDKQRLGPLELSAEGNVTIEGQDPRQGAFTARGNRATYDQRKTMFVLQGLPNQPAKIWRQQYVGAPHSVGSAQKIQYWLNTGQASGKGFRWEINQFR
ncbi:hypothetical protein OAS39_04940 [Pirellulales bacterium]|nr:hypothetical protein [Pirellulales bacterium]